MPGKPISLLAFAALALAACSGSGPSSAPSYVKLFNTGSTASSTVAVLNFDPTNTNPTSATETLARSNGDIVLGGLSGSYDPATGVVTFDAGGIAQLQIGDTDYVATFSAEPVGADPFVGLVGIQTVSGDMPTSGSTNYAGPGAAVMVIITDTGTVYDLTGDVTVSVDFATDEVDMSFSNLDGTKNVVGTGTSQIADVATLDVTGASVVGETFSGGSADMTSTELNALTGTEVVTTNGMFFGPNADEVGGLLKVDDSATGEIVVQTHFTAN